MNCSFRIIDLVHIGQQVRKTSDKSTVPFDNKPMKDVKIESYNKMGFVISHPSMPKHAWLDFKQLPLCEVTIERGIIKTELTFVEKLHGTTNGGTALQLIRTDTFDYLELLDDRKQKDEAEKFKLSDLKVGDCVSSCICREATPMYYLGTFDTVYAKSRYDYGSYRNNNYTYWHYIDRVTKRAFFAYKQSDGRFKIMGYPLTHKMVAEFYRKLTDCSLDSVRFNDELGNLLDIQNVCDYEMKNDKGPAYKDYMKVSYSEKDSLGYQLIYVDKLPKEKLIEEAIKEADINYSIKLYKQKTDTYNK